MNKVAKEKYFIVAERYNPQLGVYLSNVFVGSKTYNQKTGTFTCRYEDLGSKTSKRFTSDGYCVSRDKSIYGSMSYRGFELAADAISYLQRRWPEHHNLERCLKKINESM